VPTEDFRAAARELGFPLSGGQIAAFAAYRDLIVTAAAAFNLTAVRDPSEIERRHFLESLALGRLLLDLGLLAPGRADRVLDLGSGAGLPGLPIKIVLPEIRLTLLEANEKRCRFLRDAIQSLGLTGADVLEGRAEVWAHDAAHREAYDLVMARAVAPLAVLAEYAFGFVRAGGHFAAPKGSSATREIAETANGMTALGGEIAGQYPLLPPGGRPQTLIVFRKAAPTPDHFPRRPGIARKRPLA
jgi:16S rRNA (guanine527-N7)-methyltransferase